MPTPHPLDPAADFADDGGTPTFRQRDAERRASRPAAIWWAIRLAWFIPGLVPLSAFAFAGLWFACGLILGPGVAPAPLLAAAGALLALRCLPRGALSGVPLALVRPAHPIVTRGDAAAALAQTYVISVYGFYALAFWCVAIAIGVTFL